VSDMTITIPGWILEVFVVFVPSMAVGALTLRLGDPFEALMATFSCVGGLSAFLTWRSRRER
jgi:membrane protein implicated in regulation of membrane protease activity